jgi:hypothetical protein
MYKLTVVVESDSGVGPYKKTYIFANCSYKNGNWLDSENINIEHRFHTGAVDCKITVIKFKKQKRFIHT